MKAQRGGLMAIQPIDLQAIFTQLDKVAKTQTAQREGLQIQESLQQIQVQKKLEENVQSVNQAQNMGQEAETIRDENRRGAQGNKEEAGEKQNQSEDGKTTAENLKPALIRDPALGRNIDISG